MDLNGVVLFHAGPIIKQKDDKYEIVAVGPTTSMRMNPYEADVLDMGVKAVIGKGGMDEKTQEALVRNNAVFLTAVFLVFFAGAFSSAAAASAGATGALTAAFFFLFAGTTPSSVTIIVK